MNVAYTTNYKEFLGIQTVRFLVRLIIRKKNNTDADKEVKDSTLFESSGLCLQEVFS